jgi:hypothetical protein
MQAPQKPTAALGRLLGQSKRRGRKYVILSVADAAEIHAYLSALVKAEYQIFYKNMKP